MVQPSPAPPFHALDAERVVAALESRREGLSSVEARERLAEYGPNQLLVAKPASAWKILLAQVRSVVVLLLAVAAAFSLVVGDTLDAAAIGAVLLINTALGFTTELRARRAMHGLLKLETPHAIVVRDGAVSEIESRALVPGDVIEMEAGRAVPADARVLHAVDLRASEAALTGESLPVVKTSEPVPEDLSLPDRRDMLYAGTWAVAGTGRAIVVATGNETELGRIGKLVGGVAETRTPLERRLDALGRRLAWLALLAGAVVAVLGVLQGVPLDAVIQTSIALAIAAVPEGLPAVATIALAVGVRRMARRNALVRRLPSVETLGAVTVLCSDKTGTLTAGEMTITTFSVGGHDIDVSGTGYTPTGEFTVNGRPLTSDETSLLRDSLRAGALANRAAVEQSNGDWQVRGDPTEVALLIAALKGGLHRDRILEDWPEIGHVPFSSERMWMATFHRSPDGRVVAQMKGAPDRVLERCVRVATSDGERDLDTASRDQLMDRNREVASRGLRVLGLAHGAVPDPAESALHDLVFLGLAGMIDPVAPGVDVTIRTLRDAGIRTVMITGDQQPTAQTVALELGILTDGGEVLGGQQLGALTADERTARIPNVSVFSRVSPEQKLQIISAYQDHGQIVAMLGDGVNDAAALKKADVGVAMGGRGTDVAREVAAVVLRDDRFATIGAAVEEGRVIYDNIRKFVFYLFSCNLAEVCVLVGAGLFGMPLPLTPLQILWLNIVTDTFPALALAFEPAEANVMRRSPRDPARAILSPAFLRAVAFHGLLMATSGIAAFAIGLAGGGGPARATTLCFMTLALAQAFHLGNARSMGPVVSPRRAFANPFAVAAVVLVVALQLLAVYVPPLARVLGTIPLDARDWLFVLPLALLAAVVGQTIEIVRERRAGADDARTDER
jgi:Ca2+-transporting ATPase